MRCVLYDAGSIFNLWVFCIEYIRSMNAIEYEDGTYMYQV
jgi:hypothetical protein